MGKHPGEPAKPSRVLISAATVVALGAATQLAGCAKDGTAPPQNYCAPSASSLSAIASADGKGRIFNPDPMAASGNPLLAPTSSNLDAYAQDVALPNLNGLGVLRGKYVDVRDGDV